MTILNKKIKAFTISELLVTLVVSTLVIGLAMLILNLINKQLGMMHSNTNGQTEVRLLEKALQRDFNTHELFMNARQHQLQGVSEKDTVTYKFSESYVIRNNDTLEVPIFTMLSYLDGNLKVHGAIDALSLQLSKTLSAQKIFIYKTKDAAFYMNDMGSSSKRKE